MAQVLGSGKRRHFEYKQWPLGWHIHSVCSSYHGIHRPRDWVSLRIFTLEPHLNRSKWPVLIVYRFFLLFILPKVANKTHQRLLEATLRYIILMPAFRIGGNLLSTTSVY